MGNGGKCPLMAETVEKVAEVKVFETMIAPIRLRHVVRPLVADHRSTAYR